MNATKVLIIGKWTQEPTALSDHFRRLGCEYRYAPTHEEARILIEKDSFDLVLSDFDSRDGIAHGLRPLIVRMGSSLFFYLGVQDSCWWLPAVLFGRDCWGEAALHPEEFFQTLNDILGKIQAQSPATRASNDRTLLEIRSQPSAAQFDGKVH